MKNQRQRGDMFKRNFILYVVTTLVKGQQTMKVNYIVLKSLVNLKEVKNLNWCGFTLDSLISCMEKWKKQPKGAYRDPILFLMVMVFTYIFTKLVFILILLFVEVYALMTCFFLLMFYYSCAMLIVSCE